MKNNLYHRSIQFLLGISAFLLVSTNLNAQKITGTISTRIFHNSGPTADSKLTYLVTLSNGWNQGISVITSVVLKDLTTGTNTYATGTGYASYNDYGTLPASFPAGSYELKIIMSTTSSGGLTVSVTAIANVWIGNKVYWENCFDMEPGVSQYSVKRSKATSGQTYSYAQSFDSLASGALGWVEMSKLNSNMNDSRVYWILEAMSNPRSFTPTDNLTHVEFYRDGSGVSGIKVRYKQTGGTYRDSVLPGIAATDKVRFQRNANGTAILQINNSLTTKFSFPSTITGALKITVLAKQLNDQVDQIATSYSFPSSNYPMTTSFHSSYSENSNTGTVTTRLKPLSGYTSPYNYFVTASPMDDMKSIYKYLKDSIYTAGVDSTTFFQGSTSSTTLVSPYLPSGSYYSNVFDSKGVRIYTNRQEVMPAYVFGQQNLFENSYNEFLSTARDSYITLNTYVTEEDRSSFIYHLSDTSGQQAFGVLPENNTITGGTGSTHFSQLKYGFAVKSSKLYLIVTGAKVDSVTAKRNVPIELVFGDGVVVFRQEGTVLRTETLDSAFTYKSGMYLKSWGIPLSLTPVNVRLRPYKITGKVENNECDASTAKLTVNYTALHGASITSPSFTLYNITDETSPTTYDASVSNGEVFSSIPFGVYSLEGSFNIGANNYTNVKRVIYVGPELSWDPVSNLQSGLPDHFAVSNSTVTGTPSNSGKAIAINKLNAATPGWVVFTPVISPNSHTFNHRRTTVSFGEAPQLSSVAVFDQNMPSVTFKGAVGITASMSGGGAYVDLFEYAPNTPLLVARYPTSNDVKYRQNYTVFSTVTSYSDGRWKPAVYSQFASSGIVDAFASFQCKPYTTDIFAHLKYELDGYFHVMNNCRINFLYNEEYNSSTLNFTIYTDDMIKQYDQGDFPAVPLNIGENRVSLFIGDSEHCLTDGNYILDVVNEKKEHFYLRFYKTDCMNCASEGGH